MTLQSRFGSGQYLVAEIFSQECQAGRCLWFSMVELGLYLGVATSLTVSHWGHETQGPVIWSFEDAYPKPGGSQPGSWLGFSCSNYNLPAQIFSAS